MLNILYKCVRWVIGLVFIYSGVTKLVAPVYFSTLIGAYGIIPDNLTILVAYVLSVSEIIAGIGVFFDFKGSLALLSLLLMLFMGVLVYGIYIGLDIDCGCFGPEDPESTAFHGLREALKRDGFMVGGIIYLYGFRYMQSVQTVSVIKIFMNYFKGEVNDAACS